MKILLTLGFGAAVALSACGGAAASPQTGTTAPAAATLSPAAATLPPASATLPPASPTAAASAPAASAGSDALARGKKVYETAGEVGCIKCHGPEGKGGITETGDNAPDIRGAIPQKVYDAVSGGVGVMAFLKLSSVEIDDVIVYLNYLNK